MDFGDRARQFICAVSGHDDTVCIEGHRIFVKCRHCGRMSSGLQMPLGQQPTSAGRHVRRVDSISGVGTLPTLSTALPFSKEMQ
jgi:hypothetical protein